MEPEAKVAQLVEHLFRQETGRIISALTGSFGLQHLESIEDATQEAMLKALRVWPFGEIPANPAAWLTQVARNHALDQLRRGTRWRGKSEALAHAQEDSAPPEPMFSEEEIRDDQLRMIFACCHPALGREAQIALTLKILCGFGIGEIARAFLVTPETVAKRLTRARQRLQEGAAPFEIPSGPALAARLDAALDVFYLLFNEGYNASQGEALIRRELCEEAVRLTSLLLQNAATDLPKTHALLALFHLQRARFPARLDGAGDLLLLSEQDRSTWDRAMIARGMAHLELARAGEEISEFHLQAGIAACHCLAENYDATDWQRILFFYDLLREMNESPVVALNRAVAIWKVRGPAAASAAIEAIAPRERLQNYYLLYAVLGELERAVGKETKARENFEHALRLTSIPAEQNFLRRRLFSPVSISRENF